MLSSYSLLMSYTFDLKKLIIFILIFFIVIFFLIKSSVKAFIYNQIDKVLKSSLLVDKTNFSKENLEADFELFFHRIIEFADLKQKEIEKLNTREDFRREFLGDVSHELKTPLFTAQGYLLTILDGSIDDKKMELKYLDRANKSIERLNFIVKDLDMISKLESGMELNFESFNIIKLVSDVFDLLEIKAGKKNISLKFDKAYDFPILVEADKERIEQVLINLISNSINYGKNYGETIVSVRSFSKTQFKVSVADNGIGIPDGEILRIFERFFRVDKSRSREQGGSGLGLAIVKHIIEAHKQEVYAKSDVGVGSTFSFTLHRVL